MNFIPYGRQSISDKDIEEVVQVLQSDWLTQGPSVPRFEQAVTAMCGARHAVAVNSATSALHMACLALGLGPGDHLWTVPNTFVASANCGLYCGAKIDFVDIDSATFNMSVDRLREKLADAASKGTLPKIVIPVHFGGQPTDQEAIWALSEEYGFKIIEDASHAIGASRRQERVGSCHWSHITIFSFHPVKIVTSGEGGMATTNDSELAWNMEMLRSHGITRAPDRLQQADAAPWVYEQQMLGFNYRMTDIHAALGTSQMDRLDLWVARRNELADQYAQHFTDLPLQAQRVEPENRSAYHLYVVRLPLEMEGAEHRRVFAAMREQGIGVNLHYSPIHLQPYYQQLGFGSGMFPEAEQYARQAISLPMHPSLSDEDQMRVVDVLKKELPR